MPRRERRAQPLEGRTALVGRGGRKHGTFMVIERMFDVNASAADSCQDRRGMPRERENQVTVKFPLSAAVLFALTCAGAVAQSPPTPGPAPLRLSFVSHAAFFSLHAKQARLVDPEVFVSAPGEPPATSFQIAHAAGIRNALMSDDGAQPARDANGRELGVDLQRWFSATGLVAFLPAAGPGGGQTISVQFAETAARVRSRQVRMGVPTFRLRRRAHYETATRSYSSFIATATITACKPAPSASTPKSK